MSAAAIPPARSAATTFVMSAALACMAATAVGPCVDHAELQPRLVRRRARLAVAGDVERGGGEPRVRGGLRQCRPRGEQQRGGDGHREGWISSVVPSRPAAGFVHPA